MTVTISAAVGRNATNVPADVMAIQGLLNHNRHLLIPFTDLPLDGMVNATLIPRIEAFQRRVMFATTPDGRVDPGGHTLAKLNENAKDLPQSIPLFPFPRHPVADFTCGAREFGADRDGGRRKHAGVDLMFAPGTAIRAMEDGVVLVAPAPFYDSVMAFAVDHGSFVARYGEISKAAPGCGRVGAKVKKGDIIAFVGRLSSGNSMLHLELYSGTASGPLTDRSRMPFQRRSDLLNPMEFVQAATLTIDDKQHDGNARVGIRVVRFLNVHSAPDVTAPIVIKLPPGQYFDVVAEVTDTPYLAEGTNRTDWVQIDIEGTSGFAGAFYVDRVSTGPTGPVTGSITAGAFSQVGASGQVGTIGRVGTRIESVLHLRQAPDHAAASLAQLQPGALLEIRQKLRGSSYNAGGVERTDWLAVQATGQNGFVAAFYVDPVLLTGRTNRLVTTHLIMREEPAPDAPQLAGLTPGATFSVLRAATGEPYVVSGAEHNDWLDIEHDSKRGFVAAVFVDLLDPARPPDLNAILFTYEPTGAAEATASQDGLPAQGISGVAASAAMAQTDRGRVMAHKPQFVAAGRLFDLPPALLAAIASRETRGGYVLKSEGWGDHDNAFGIMQVDKRFHSPIETAGGPAGEAHIHQATAILRDQLDGVRRHFEGLSDSHSLQAAVSRYNGGSGRLPPNSDVGTTGGDYMNDVWARARYYAAQGSWS